MRTCVARTIVIVIAGFSVLAWLTPCPAQEAASAHTGLNAGVAIPADSPAQAIYEGWPPDELSERLYAMPWSHLAFNRAEMLGRPVLFVLTVDWNRAAQKMTMQTLASGEILRAVNRGYVTILVNADMRPDVAERYKTGAWPVIAFLLPNGKPMLSQANDMGVAKPITTTLVPEAAMVFLLDEGTKYWRKWQPLLMQVGDQWTATEGPEKRDPGTADTTASDYMARWLLGNADGLDGGFGASPKFMVGALEDSASLLEARGLSALRRHSRLTLERLVAGPLFDAREGGMHRLAGGPSFTQIEYEKMLEGNAALVRQLVLTLRWRDSQELRTALASTASFIIDVLGRPGGGFYLAQAADPTSDDGGGYWNQDPPGAPPPIDRIVLSGPNATAGAALIRAGLLLKDARLTEAGKRAAELILENAYRAGRGVFHVIEPHRDPRVYLVAQSSVALAFIDIYESTGDRAFLDAARNIVDFSLAHLRSSPDQALLDRMPDPTPLGLLSRERRPLRPNIKMARAMVHLALHGLGESYRTEALQIIAACCGELSAFGVHGTEGALAIEEATVEPVRVVISGAPTSAGVAALRRAALNSPTPWMIVDSGDDAGHPRAKISFKGKTIQARNPGALQDGILRITGGGEGS